MDWHPGRSGTGHGYDSFTWLDRNGNVVVHHWVSSEDSLDSILPAFVSDREAASQVINTIDNKRSDIRDKFMAELRRRTRMQIDTLEVTTSEERIDPQDICLAALGALGIEVN